MAEVKTVTFVMATIMLVFLTLCLPAYADIATYELVINLKSEPVVFKGQIGKWIGDINIFEYIKSDVKSESIDLWPGTHDLWSEIIFRDAKWCYTTLWMVNLKGVGEYTLYTYFTVTNPSNKWRHVLYTYVRYSDPTDIMERVDLVDWYPGYIVIPRETIVGGLEYTYEFKNKVTGTIWVVCESHSCYTDVNNDGKVDILDIASIARNYGKSVPSKYDPLIVYDMDVDLLIELDDIYIAVLDFGFVVPP